MDCRHNLAATVQSLGEVAEIVTEGPLTHVEEQDDAEAATGRETRAACLTDQVFTPSQYGYAICCRDWSKKIKQLIVWKRCGVEERSGQLYRFSSKCCSCHLSWLLACSYQLSTPGLTLGGALGWPLHVISIST